MGELEHILGHLDFFRAVTFGDDDFLARPVRQLEEFAEKYKSRVGLPFSIEASPNTFRKKKIEILLDAGINIIEIGVQSGSQRVLEEVFNRRIPVSKTVDVLHQVEPYQETHDLELMLDFIIDNPYETKADIMQTYRYLVDIPQQATINMFTLAFTPGTPLYERAVKDVLIEPYSEATFKGCANRSIRFQNNYETLIVLLAWSLHNGRLRRYVPKFALRALGSRLATSIASIVPGVFYVFLIRAVLVPARLYRFVKRTRITMRRR
jgi:coproporphyrinogen III oxidase-like Fe-S oxidoreductase